METIWIITLNAGAMAILINGLGLSTLLLLHLLRESIKNARRGGGRGRGETVGSYIDRQVK